MRWETIASAPDNEVYHLYKDDKKILTLTLHPFYNYARVEGETEKRVGELGHEHMQNFIDLNNERFFYTIHNNPLAELVIYKESKDKPIVVCGLNTDKGSTGIHFKKDHSLTATSHPGLLMALCWYMFLPVTKENVPAFAV